jgi:uncharacterized membrane protein YeaQ/YmgE (transglycosylase-associated protein family)
MRNLLGPPTRGTATVPVAAPGWLVWLRWVVANLLGGIVGYLVGSMLSPIFGSFPTLLMGIMGAIVGVAQWQTMRDFVPGLNGTLWVAFTGLGYGLAGPLLELTGYAMALTSGTLRMWEEVARNSDSVRATLELIVNWRYPLALVGAAAVGMLGGATLGLAQAWVLRRHTYDAWIWIAASALGGMLGTFLGLLVAVLLYPPQDNTVARVVLVLFMVPSGVFLVGSLVTGGALHLLRDRLKPG